MNKHFNMSCITIIYNTHRCSYIRSNFISQLQHLYFYKERIPMSTYTNLHLGMNHICLKANGSSNSLARNIHLCVVQLEIIQVSWCILQLEVVQMCRISIEHAKINAKYTLVLSFKCSSKISFFIKLIFTLCPLITLCNKYILCTATQLIMESVIQVFFRY